VGQHYTQSLADNGMIIGDDDTDFQDTLTIAPNKELEMVRQLKNTGGFPITPVFSLSGLNLSVGKS
jgi:hypothetical protein